MVLTDSEDYTKRGEIDEYVPIECSSQRHGMRNKDLIVRLCTFFGYEGLQQHDGSLVARPRVHLPVRISSFLRELIPRLRFRKQLRHGPLGQAEHVFRKQPLTDIVHGQQLTDSPTYVQRVKVAIGVFVHVVSEHFLEAGFHRVAFRDEGVAEAADESPGW